MFVAGIPSPALNVIALGPLKIHFYALAILLGIVVAIKVTDRRLIAMGERAGLVSDIAIIVVPAGIIGGRLYHVLTTPELYFGKNGRLLDALKIWNGGLGIWGAISIGALAAWWSYWKVKMNLSRVDHIRCRQQALINHVQQFLKPSEILPWITQA